MASPTISAEGAIATQTTTGVDLSVTLPTHAPNDILVVTVQVWSPDTVASIDVLPTISGWTKQADIPITVAGLDGRMGFYWRRATSSSETNPVFPQGANWIITTTGLYSGRAYTISGCIGIGVPWDDFNPSAPQIGVNPPFDALTVAGTERLAVQFFVSDDNNAAGGTMSGWTANTGVDTTAGSDAGYQSFFQSNLSASTSSGTSSHAAANQGQHMFFGVTFRPTASTATLHNPVGGANFMQFSPISSVLNNLQAGAGTIAALLLKGSDASSMDIAGLTQGTGGAGTTNWYHAMHLDQAGLMRDDDGLVGVTEGGSSWGLSNSDWYIMVVTWASGTVVERFHHIDQTSPAGWTHTNASGNNGGNRAGPGTTVDVGSWIMGYFGDGISFGDYALCAAWVGVALSDAQCQELSANNKTSDWWNNSAGHPDLLIECTSLTPIDIGNNPSAFRANSGMTLAGALPSWTFDGQGAAIFDSNPLSDRHAGRFGPF